MNAPLADHYVLLTPLDPGRPAEDVGANEGKGWLATTPAASRRWSLHAAC